MGCEELVEYVRCVCVWLGAVGGEGGEWRSGGVDWVWVLLNLWERGSVRRVSVFWLRWCGWRR